MRGAHRFMEDHTGRGAETTRAGRRKLQLRFGLKSTKGKLIHYTKPCTHWGIGNVICDWGNAKNKRVNWKPVDPPPYISIPMPSTQCYQAFMSQAGDSIVTEKGCHMPAFRMHAV